MEAITEADDAKNKTNPKTPLCCQGCVRWLSFGKSCWYYWEGKKHCTVWTPNFSDKI